MEIIMSWIGLHIIEILTFLLVCITGVYAILTGRYVRLTNRLIKTTTNTPKIAIYLGHENTRIGSDILCAENIGTGPAYHIRIKTDLSFLIHGSNDPARKTLRDVGFLKDGINYLHPGGKRARSLSLSHRLKELEETPLNISVTYKDSEENEYRDCFCLDFGELTNSSYNRSPLFDIAKRLENIEKRLR